MPQDKESEFAFTHSGAVYPTNYVAAVIDDPQDAEKAVQALRDAGYKSEDIRIFHGSELSERVQEKQQKQGTIGRIASALVGGGEDGGDVQKYMEEARKGHSVLNVYARKAEDANRVRDILAPFHAHTINHFGSWTVTPIATPQ